MKHFTTFALEMPKSRGSERYPCYPGNYTSAGTCTIKTNLSEDASSLPKLVPLPVPLTLPETDGNINVEFVEARDCQDVDKAPFQDVQW